MSVDAHPGKATYIDDFIHFSKTLPPGVFREANVLYASGLSLFEISKRLRKSKDFIRRTLIAGGVSMRPSTHVPDHAGSWKRRPGRGAAPYGFTFHRGQLVVHPAEIDHLLLILELWKQGQGPQAIARHLNGRGIPSKMGKRWRHPAVSSIVHVHKRDPELLHRLASTLVRGGDS